MSCGMWVGSGRMGGMARRIHLHPHLNVDELERRYRAAKEPNERTWWQIPWLLAQGRTATELSGVMGYRAYCT